MHEIYDPAETSRSDGWEGSIQYQK